MLFSPVDALLRDPLVDSLSLPVYLDNQATTPIDPRVAEEVWHWFTEDFGNPHSLTHEFGRNAAEAVERARAQVAVLINADPREVHFTSGATESNNLAIKGAARFERRFRNRRNRIITLETEHKCVIESVRSLTQEGFDVVFLPVQQNGLLDLNELERSLDENTLLVTVMAANNEIGTIQPIAEIARLAHASGALFHTDAAQAVGKIPINVSRQDIDLMSISGHKLYGPKGIGALYVRRRPRARIEPLFSGGGQERTLRSGTVPTALAVGIGAACKIAQEEMDREATRLLSLSRLLLERLDKTTADIVVNGDMESRLPGNLSLSIAGISALDLINRVPDLALSTGSACTSTEVEPSHVLRAIGLDERAADSAIRLGLGRFTTRQDIEFTAQYLADAIVKCRSESA